MPHNREAEAVDRVIETARAYAADQSRFGVYPDTSLFDLTMALTALDEARAAL